MSNNINAYQAVKRASEDLQSEAGPSHKKAKLEGPSFKDTLSQMGESFTKDMRGLEKSMTQFSNGQISAEDVIMQTKAVTLEAEGFMGVGRAIVESGKKILDMQI
jgi:flagellar hook-basal body complex protein FliE